VLVLECLALANDLGATELMFDEPRFFLKKNLFCLEERFVKRGMMCDVLRFETFKV
jgi:hypothetical protein